MARKKVVCSFDYTHDKDYYHLLSAWNNNPNINFSISDCTPSEIQTDSVSVIKGKLTQQIREANYMIAIVGKYFNSTHPDSYAIGYKNWQIFEIEKNHEEGNGLVVVLLDNNISLPSVCYGKNAEIVRDFKLDKIERALNNLIWR